MWLACGDAPVDGACEYLKSIADLDGIGGRSGIQSAQVCREHMQVVLRVIANIVETWLCETAPASHNRPQQRLARHTLIQ